MANDSTTVAVAKGQIRRGRLRYQAQPVPYEVLDVGDLTATIRQTGHESTAGVCIEDLQRWPCIGIETADGRVMVGERRQNPGNVGGTYEVFRIGDFGMVEAHGVDFVSSIVGPAEGFARWPLASPPIPQGAEAPESKPEPEAWDTVTFGGVSFPAKVTRCSETDRELRARYYAAAHEEHPRPGTVAWLVKSIAYLCSIPKSDVTVQEDHARARVIVRVPRPVTPANLKAVRDWGEASMPAPIALMVEHAPDPREQGPGIARLPRPTVRPDVVVCAEWEEKWCGA